MPAFSPLALISPWRLWRDARIGGIVAVAAGFVIALLGVLYWLPVQRVQTWATAEGKITASAVQPTEVWGRQGRMVYYAANVKYEYAVKGETFTGSQLGYELGTAVFGDPARALQVVAQYPVGRTVIVHFDPDRPNEALLNISGTNGGALLMGFGAFFVVFGLVILILFRKRPRQA